MKCKECITQKKAENCQACYQAQKQEVRQAGKLAERTAEKHKKALQTVREAHQETERQNLELITKIKRELHKIIEDKKLFQTRNLLFNFLEDLEISEVLTKLINKKPS